MQKNWGIKRVVNYTDIEKLSHIIEHGLQGFIVKNIQGESTEANDLKHILWLCPNVTNVFTKFNPLRGILNHRTDARRANKNGIRWCVLPKI